MALTHTLMNYVSSRNGWNIKMSLDITCMNLTCFSFLFLVIFAEDVFLMNSKDPKNPIVYGVFTTSRYRAYHFLA